MVKACFRCIKKCGSTEVNLFFVGELIIFAGVPCRPPSRGVRTLVSGRSHPCPGARCWLRPKGAFQKHDIDYMTRFVCEMWRGLLIWMLAVVTTTEVDVTTTE